MKISKSKMEFELNIINESNQQEIKTFLTEAEAIEEASKKNTIVAYY